jgi:hypothetical protein
MSRLIYLSFIIYQSSINYHLPFSRKSANWLMANNLANGNCELAIASKGGLK